MVNAAALHLFTGCRSAEWTPAGLTAMDYATATMLITGLIAVIVAAAVCCAALSVTGALAYVLTGMQLTLHRYPSSSRPVLRCSGDHVAVFEHHDAGGIAALGRYDVIGPDADGWDPIGAHLCAWRRTDADRTVGAA